VDIAEFAEAVAVMPFLARQERHHSPAQGEGRAWTPSSPPLSARPPRMAGRASTVRVRRSATSSARCMRGG
jgi:hypothetical protein